MPVAEAMVDIHQALLIDRFATTKLYLRRIKIAMHKSGDMIFWEGGVFSVGIHHDVGILRHLPLPEAEYWEENI